MVKDIMKKNVISVKSTDTIKDAAVTMDKANIGSVVITKDNHPVGILTERDFVRRICAKEILLSTQVSEVMSNPLITIDVDETVWDVADLMKTNGIHKLPVTENENLVGMVSNTDLIELGSYASSSELRNICDQIFLRMKNK